MDLGRKSSKMWKFFTPVDKYNASCNFCQQTLSFKSSTSNLKAHLRRKHKRMKFSSGENDSNCGNSAGHAIVHLTPAKSDETDDLSEVSYKGQEETNEEQETNDEDTNPGENLITILQEISTMEENNDISASIKQRKTSKIWNFFNPINEAHASCTLCKQILSYKSTISNLITHLTRKHPSLNYTSTKDPDAYDNQIVEYIIVPEKNSKTHTDGETQTDKELKNTNEKIFTFLQGLSDHCNRLNDSLPISDCDQEEGCLRISGIPSIIKGLSDHNNLLHAVINVQKERLELEKRRLEVEEKILSVLESKET